VISFVKTLVLTLEHLVDQKYEVEDFGLNTLFGVQQMTFAAEKLMMLLVQE
jgi:hypothetical protein